MFKQQTHSKKVHILIHRDKKFTVIREVLRDELPISQSQWSLPLFLTLFTRPLLAMRYTWAGQDTRLTSEAVADSGGVRGVQMHPPLAASNVF